MEFFWQEYWSRLPFPLQGSSRPKDQTCISCISSTGRWIIYCYDTWEAIMNSCLFIGQSLSHVWLLCDPMDCSTPGFSVHHQLLELAQTHFHWVGGAIQPSHPLSSSSPSAFNLSQHQSLFIKFLVTANKVGILPTIYRWRLWDSSCKNQLCGEFSNFSYSCIYLS